MRSWWESWQERHRQHVATWGTKTEGRREARACAFVSHRVEESLLGVALFNLMQLVEPPESIACSKKECFRNLLSLVQGFLHASVVKNLPGNVGDTQEAWV